MAETKSKKRSGSKRAGSSRKSKTQSKSKPKTQSKNQSRSKAKSKSSALGGAGQAVGKVASKAKVPLVAGGAAIAGAAGGMALAASRQGRKKGMKSLKAAMPRKPKVKIKSGDLAKAAKEVGNFSAQMGELATELQRARESANGNGKHRSPVEVVLQGLTARR